MYTYHRPILTLHLLTLPIGLVNCLEVCLLSALEVSGCWLLNSKRNRDAVVCFCMQMFSEVVKQPALIFYVFTGDDTHKSEARFRHQKDDTHKCSESLWQFWICKDDTHKTEAMFVESIWHAQIEKLQLFNMLMSCVKFTSRNLWLLSIECGGWEGELRFIFTRPIPP